MILHRNRRGTPCRHGWAATLGHRPSKTLPRLAMRSAPALPSQPPCFCRAAGPANAGSSLQLSPGPPAGGTGRLFLDRAVLARDLWSVRQATGCRMLCHVCATADVGICVDEFEGSKFFPGRTGGRPMACEAVSG
jgi:hypothetical protein